MLQCGSRPSYVIFLQGVNLRTAHSEKTFTFINGLSSPYEWTDDVTMDSTNDQVLALQSIANAHPFTLQTSSPTPLKGLFDAIKRIVEANSAKSHRSLVVVDNLSILAMSTSEYETIQFVQQLKIYLASRPVRQVVSLSTRCFGLTCSV